MARIIIAGVSQAAREQLSRLLASSGFDVFRLCASGSKLRRAINECGDAAVIIAGRLKDCTADELVWDFRRRVHILLIARPEVLETCESDEVFRLELPVSARDVVWAAERLTLTHMAQLPKRSADDKSTVEKAKLLVMQRCRLGEDEAHRLMQRYSMDHGIKMTDLAAMILDGTVKIG